MSLSFSFIFHLNPVPARVKAKIAMLLKNQSKPVVFLSSLECHGYGGKSNRPLHQSKGPIAVIP
jgi:hypothetical protein